MTWACIDIGSNTTRLLVAEVENGVVRELVSQRAYTRLAQRLGPSERLADREIAEIAEAVARQARAAVRLGAHKGRVLGTAAVREVDNADALASAVRAAASTELEVLTEEDEARLAFRGASTALGTSLPTSLGVVDMGGGSTEIAVGRRHSGVHWWRSVRVGSGRLADALLRSDPPHAAELVAARAHVEELFADVHPPGMDRAVIVGGAARSLTKLLGDEIWSKSLAGALDLLATRSSVEVAERIGLDLERARLVPGGALILEALVERLPGPLTFVRAGLREGALLELAEGRR